MPDHECSECGKSFDSKRGLSIHQTQMHGEENSGEENKREDGQGSSWDIKIPKPGVSGKKPLVAVLLLGIALGFGAGYMSPDISSLIPEEEPKVDISKIDNQGDPVLGSQDAEVTMVVYEDFECPFCARFEQRAVPRIKQNYVDSGKVKIVWKDFPLTRIHPWATDASETMECVYRQDEEAFWKVKDSIFSNQDSLDVENAEDRIVGWASEEGVDEQAVRSCLETGNPGEEVAEDLKEGRSFDIEVGGSPFVAGTPATVIYAEGDSEGEPVVGAQPYSRFKTVIDSKLE